MAHLQKHSVASVSNVCEWCLGAGNSRCGRCHNVYYCCREHQVKHWSTHKTACKAIATPVIPLSTSISQPSTSNVTFSSCGNWEQKNIPCSTSEEINLAASGNVYNDNSVATPGTPMGFSTTPDIDEIFSSLTSEMLSSDNKFWSDINTSDTRNISLDLLLEKDANKIITEVQGQTSSSSVSSTDNSSVIANDDGLMQRQPLNAICFNIVHDLNIHGICVLDKFLGTKSGCLILQEVKNLYLKGIFRKGELINPSPYAPKENIRSDVMTWVNGTEPECKHIGNFMKKLDVVLTTCNKMKKNGLLSKYKLHRRTKAMVACYPGNGTYYKKHVDNPHKDGRCITCIYYLNKDWNAKVHGGLLRMFPTSNASHVAVIEPLFDRMIFFWSDKRNPHEVLPSYSTRFAITLWYFDADERDQALRMAKEKAVKANTFR